MDDHFELAYCKNDCLFGASVPVDCTPEKAKEVCKTEFCKEFKKKHGVKIKNENLEPMESSHSMTFTHTGVSFVLSNISIPVPLSACLPRPVIRSS